MLFATKRWLFAALQAGTVLVAMASENNLATKFYEQVDNLATGAVEKADGSSTGFFPI